MNKNRIQKKETNMKEEKVDFLIFLFLAILIFGGTGLVRASTRRDTSSSSSGQPPQAAESLPVVRPVTDASWHF
jgi:hypothetical protein